MATFDDFAVSGKIVPASLLDDEPWTVPLFTRQYEKIASEIYIPDRIKIAIANITPRDDGHHLLVHGLGGAEAWGSNRNGDAFPEYINGEPHLVKSGADYGYGTFEKYAYPYRNHKNHDPKHTIGEQIKYAAYNDKMHRVETVVFIKRALAPDACEAIDNGEDLAWSMGTKVAYDICSKCHNKAKNRSEYCDHLKLAMNRIHPDGSKNYAINPYPKFFDMSWVKRGADPQALTLHKIAREQKPMFNVPAGKVSIVVPVPLPKVADEKEADIDKEVPVKADAVPEKVVEHLSKDLPKDEGSRPVRRTVIMIISKKDRPFENRLSDLLHAGIFPTGEEARQAGLKDEDIPDSCGCPMPDLKELMNLAPLMKSSSMLDPYLSDRLIELDRSDGVKEATYNSKIDKLIYRCFSDSEWCEKFASHFDIPEVAHLVFPPETLAKQAGIGSALFAPVRATAGYFSDIPTGRTLSGLGIGLLGSAGLRGAAEHGKDLNVLQRFIAKHPILTGFGTAGIMHALPAMFGKAKGVASPAVSKVVEKTKPVVDKVTKAFKGKEKPPVD